MYDEIRNKQEPWVSPIELVLVGFAVIASFFLIAEHRAHALSLLPFLLLAGCPLLHFFMHEGHGHGGHGRGQVPGKTVKDVTAAGSLGQSVGSVGGGWLYARLAIHDRFHAPRLGGPLGSTKSRPRRGTQALESPI